MTLELWDRLLLTLLLLMVLAFVSGILDLPRDWVPRIVVSICVAMVGLALYRVWFAAF
jgi:hypothetical protein